MNKLNIKELKEIIKEIQDKDHTALGRIDILYELMSFDEFNELTESQQEKILDFVYTYWLDNDFTEYNIYSICDIVINTSDFYNNNILKKIDNLSYEEFEKIVNNCY